MLRSRRLELGDQVHGRSLSPSSLLAACAVALAVLGAGCGDDQGHFSTIKYAPSQAPPKQRAAVSHRAKTHNRVHRRARRATAAAPRPAAPAPKVSKSEIRRRVRQAHAQLRNAEAEHAKRIAKLDAATREKLVTGASKAILTQQGLADAQVAL